MRTLSICIPTYEMHGLGEKFLRQSFDVLTQQTFKDFDVVISDHSKTDVIKNLCDEYQGKLKINYFKNIEKVGSSSSNINNALDKAEGQLLKILFQDDFLYSKTSLEEIVENFDLEKDVWLVTASIQSKDGVTFYRPVHPRYEDRTILKKNTISSPSVLTIKNDNHILFDENLIWWMDSDYYKRCYHAFGEPKILDAINVVNRVGEHQVTNTLVNEEVREWEYQYILKKYKARYLKALIIIAKLKRIVRHIKQVIKSNI